MNIDNYCLLGAFVVSATREPGWLAVDCIAAADADLHPTAPRHPAPSRYGQPNRFDGLLLPGGSGRYRRRRREVGGIWRVQPAHYEFSTVRAATDASKATTSPPQVIFRGIVIEGNRLPCGDRPVSH
eukprot:scaffold102147_cov29-Tisochrysis_lutea.AAC.4